MIVELISFFASLFLGCASVLVKIGLTKDAHSNAISAVLITMLANSICMWPIYFLWGPPCIAEAFIVFSIVGILHLCVARTLKYMSIQKLGVSISESIIGSNPLFATITAVILLGEIFPSSTYIGIILVVIGVVLVSQRNRLQKSMKGWRSRNMCVPLASAVFFGVTATVRKIGLNILDSPVLGATVGPSAGLVVYTSFILLSRKMGSITANRHSFLLFFSSGICTSLAWLCMYFALGIGEVTVVSPIIGTVPLFTLFFSQILLKDTERITYRILLGALLVVLGVVTISVSK